MLFFGCACKIRSATDISIIPNIEEMFGLSSGNMSQLRITPETGVRNFQIFSSDTFISGFLSKLYQIEKPAAGIIESQIQIK